MTIERTANRGEMRARRAIGGISSLRRRGITAYIKKQRSRGAGEAAYRRINRPLEPPARAVLCPK